MPQSGQQQQRSEPSSGKNGGQRKKEQIGSEKFDTFDELDEDNTYHGIFILFFQNYTHLY